MIGNSNSRPPRFDNYDDWFATVSVAGEPIDGLMLPYLTHPDGRVRFWAASELEEHGDLDNPSIATALVPPLDDAEACVCWTVAEALGLWEYRPAVPALIRHLHTDKTPLVRICCGEALGYIGDLETARPALLVTLRADRAVLVRAYAASALGWMNDVASVSALWDAYMHEPNRRARMGIVAALAKLDDEDALRRLLAMFRRARTHDLRMPIINALDEITHLSMQPAIASALLRDRYRFTPQDDDAQFRAFLRKRGLAESPPDW